MFFGSDGSIPYFPPDHPVFVEKGYMSPQEFIIACDNLIATDKQGWKWMEAINENQVNKYLNYQDKNNKYYYNKQYLVLDKVACKSRKKSQQNEIQVTYDKENDVEVFQMAQNSKENESNYTLRYYQLSICYDMYYFVPRMFFTAFDKDGKEIPLNQLLDDVESAYANKVVTVDKEHPGTGKKQASVHPCKHHQVFLDSCERLRQTQGENYVGAHIALFIFLGFFSSVMPSIELDQGYQL